MDWKTFIAVCIKLTSIFTQNQLNTASRFGYGQNIPSHMQTGKKHWPHTEIFLIKAVLTRSILPFSIIIQSTGRLSNERSMRSGTFQTDGIFTLFAWPIIFTSGRQYDCSAPPLQRSLESFAQSTKRQRLSSTNLKTNSLKPVQYFEFSLSAAGRRATRPPLWPLSARRPLEPSRFSTKHWHRMYKLIPCPTEQAASVGEAYNCMS